MLTPGVPCEAGGVEGWNWSTRPGERFLVTFVGNGWAWLTGVTAGGCATTAMARSPLSAGGALPGEGAGVPPVDALGVGAGPEPEPLPEPGFDPPDEPALLFGLMVLNIDEPVSVPSTEVRLPDPSLLDRITGAG